MKRLLPEHFKLNGLPKKSFLTLHAARVEANQHEGKSAYLCSFCGKYHIGNN